MIKMQDYDIFCLSGYFVNILHFQSTLFFRAIAPARLAIGQAYYSVIFNMWRHFSIS